MGDTSFFNYCGSVCVSLLAIFVCVGLLAFAAVRPDARSVLAGDSGAQQYAVLFSPSITREEAFLTIVKAGARPVRYGIFDNILIVASDDPEFLNFTQHINHVLFVFLPFIKGSCALSNKARFKKDELI